MKRMDERERERERDELTWWKIEDVRKGRDLTLMLF